MWHDLLGVAGLAGLCGVWVLIQRFFTRHDPDAPGVEGRCGSCGANGNCEKQGSKDDAPPLTHGGPHHAR